MAASATVTPSRRCTAKTPRRGTIGFGSALHSGPPRGERGAAHANRRARERARVELAHVEFLRTAHLPLVAALRTIQRRVMAYRRRGIGNAARSPSVGRDRRHGGPMAAMKWSGWGKTTSPSPTRTSRRSAPFLRAQARLDVTRATSRPAAFEASSVPEPSLLARRSAAALEEAVGDELGVDRPARPRGPRSRQEPARPRPAPPRRARPAPGRGRPPGRRGRGGGGPARRPGRRRGADPVRRRDEHLRQPRGPGGRAAHGHLARPVAARAGCSRSTRRPGSRAVQAGAFGPDLERQLNAQGWTLGHFPDSFTHSTLGGWIATRSSGMQSDRYGDIADLTRAVRVVTPAGLLVTRPVPHTSTGPERARDGAGQRRAPGRDHRGDRARPARARAPRDPRLPVPDLGRRSRGHAGHRRERGGAVGHARLRRVRDGVLVRDQEGPDGPGPRQVQGADDVPASAGAGFDVDAMCLSFIGYEGSERHVAGQRKAVGRIVGRHGGLCIGASPGELYDQKKFDTPYIRDFLLDRGALADVSETAAPWSRLSGALRRGDGVRARRVRRARRPRLRHVPPVALLPLRRVPVLHLRVQALARRTTDWRSTTSSSPRSSRRSSTRARTLSHHHAVGTEHARWLEEDISAPGVAMLRALFDGVDPGANLNPGKIA